MGAGLGTYGDEEPTIDRYNRYREQEQDVKDRLAQFTRQPCKDWIVTRPQDVDPLNEQLLQEYKDLHYMDMINKIRADLKEENEVREAVERERTHLQRSALKAKKLLSNITMADRPDALMQSRDGSAISQGGKSHSAMRNKSGMSGATRGSRAPPAVEDKRDMNFYRKVSKYELDRLKVDWKELMRERQRQMKSNQEIMKEEQGKAKQKKKVTEAVDKMVKINTLKQDRDKNLAESKETAMKKQKELSEMIK